MQGGPEIHADVEGVHGSSRQNNQNTRPPTDYLFIVLANLTKKRVSYEAKISSQRCTIACDTHICDSTLYLLFHSPTHTYTHSYRHTHTHVPTRTCTKHRSPGRHSEVHTPGAVPSDPNCPNCEPNAPLSLLPPSPSPLLPLELLLLLAPLLLLLLLLPLLLLLLLL